MNPYNEGWDTCFRGEDGRYTNPYPRTSEEADAWNAGFLDAIEAEDGEQPDAAAAGY